MIEFNDKTKGQEGLLKNSRLLYFGRILLVTLAFYFSGLLGQQFVLPPISSSMVWLPSGIALAALIVFGEGMWLGVLFGSIWLNIDSQFSPSNPLITGLVVLGVATGNTLQAWVGAVLFRKLSCEDFLIQPSKVFRFVLITVVVGGLSATIGALSLTLKVPYEFKAFAKTWVTWTLGDACGIMLVTPLLITSALRPWNSWKKKDVLERLFFLFLIVGTNLYLFEGTIPNNWSWPYFMVPGLLVAAVRYEPWEAGMAALITSVIAVWGSINGHGPFVREGLSVQGSLVSAQVFMACSAISVISLSVLMNYQRQMATRLKNAEKILKGRIEERDLQLGESEERYRVLTSLSPVGIFHADERGKFLFVSEGWQEITGLSKEKALQDGWLNGVHRGDRQKVKEQWQKSLRYGREFYSEYRIHRNHNETHWVLVQARPQRDFSGRILGYVGSITDVTIQKQAETALKKAKRISDSANKAKSEFLANMSHEIRTPLSTIIGFSELMNHKDYKEKDLGQFAKRIDKNARHLKTLIDDILDLSKIESGQMSVEKVDIELIPFLKEILSSYREQANLKGIEFKCTFDFDLPTAIYSDPTRVRQIIHNLVGNAIKFTEKGRVGVSVRNKTTGSGQVSLIEIAVKDTGIGMTKEQQRTLFKPFAQADSSITRRFGGSGLGLILSKEIAGLLGGDVSLTRSQLDGGSEFLAAIEVGEKNNMPAGVVDFPRERTLRRQGLSKSLKGDRVLLVEDSEELQLLAESILNNAGASIDIASNGKEAISMVERKRYDIVFMDIQMPVMGGFEAFSEIKSRGYKVPVVALTACALKSEKEKCMEAGFTDFLLKPYSAEALIAATKKHGLNSAYEDQHGLV